MPQINIYTKEQVDALLSESVGTVVVVTTDAGLTVTATMTGATTQTQTADSEGRAVFNGLKPGVWTFTDSEGDSTTGEVAHLLTYVDIPKGFKGCVGFTITQTTASPTGRVAYPATLSTGSGTYTNLASGATPMSGAGSTFNIGSWGDGQLAKFLEGIKPVSFDGTTWSDLSKTDETTWPTAQGTDCFTEFPFRWFSMTISGDVITVVFSGADTAPDSTFTNWAFLGADGTTQRPNFHLGCYTCSGSTSGVYSRPGQANLVSTALNQYWVAAAARGAEYDCLPFAMWTYIQALFVLLYGSTDSQTAHSAGYTGGSAVQSNTTFTYANNYGMAGSTSTTEQNAFLWLHNLWGNMYQFIASVFVRANSNSDRSLYYILSAMSNSSNWDNSSWNSTSNYALMSSKGTDSGSDGISSSQSNFTKACGTPGAGFIPSSDASGGSSNQYFADFGRVSVYSSRASFPRVGGNYNDGENAGFFYAYVDSYSTNSRANYGSRLAYRGGHA